MKKLTFFIVVSMGLMAPTTYANQAEKEACLRALDAIKQYDPENYSVIQAAFQDCSANTSSVEHWECIISELKDGATMRNAGGLCENKEK